VRNVGMLGYREKGMFGYAPNAKPLIGTSKGKSKAVNGLFFTIQRRG